MRRRFQLRQYARRLAGDDADPVRPELLSVLTDQVQRLRILLHRIDPDPVPGSRSLHRYRACPGAYIPDYRILCKLQPCNADCPHLFLCHGHSVPDELLVPHMRACASLRERILDQDSAKPLQILFRKLRRLP